MSRQAGAWDRSARLSPISARWWWRIISSASCAMPTTWGGGTRRISCRCWAACWYPGSARRKCGSTSRSAGRPGARDSTINRELAIVRRGFRLGAQEAPPLVQRRPAISMLEEDNVRQGFLEQDQYERLLEELPASLKALFVCGYHTGARKNELRRIWWAQVDSEAGLIRLSAGQTKGKKPRTLPIYGDMRRWLERQRESCPASSTWVFHGTHNCPVGNHLNGWAEACERAGVADLLFHDL